MLKNNKKQAKWKPRKRLQSGERQPSNFLNLFLGFFHLDIISRCISQKSQLGVECVLNFNWSARGGGGITFLWDAEAAAKDFKCFQKMDTTENKREISEIGAQTNDAAQRPKVKANTDTQDIKILNGIHEILRYFWHLHNNTTSNKLPNAKRQT